DVAFLHAIYDLEASFPTIHDFNLLALDGYALVVQDRRIAGAKSMAHINAQKNALNNAQDEMTATEQRARSNLNLPPADPASPTADPDVHRRAARDAYLTAEQIESASRRRLDKESPTNPTLEQARAYYKRLGKIEARYLASLEEIGVPPDVTKDYRAL